MDHSQGSKIDIPKKNSTIYILNDHHLLIHDFINRLFLILDDVHEINNLILTNGYILSLIHNTVTLLYKYQEMNPQRGLTSPSLAEGFPQRGLTSPSLAEGFPEWDVYKIGSACFALSELCNPIDIKVHYDLIKKMGLYHGKTGEIPLLKTERLIPQGEIPSLKTTGLIPQRETMEENIVDGMRELINSFHFDLLTNNAYYLFKQLELPFDNPYLKRSTEYIIGCSLYNSELTNMDPVILIHAALFLACQWADNVYKFSDDGSFYLDGDYVQNFGDIENNPIKDSIMRCVKKLVYLIKHLYKIHGSINIINRYTKIVDNLEFLPNYTYVHNVDKKSQLVKSPRNENILSQRGLTPTSLAEGFPSRHKINKIIVDNDKYIITEQIGKGIYGTIFIGCHIQQSEPVAMKVQPYDLYTVKETSVLSHLKHPNIINIKHVFYQMTNDDLVFVMDYYRCDLTKIIKKKMLDEKIIKVYAYQILSAISYCHSLGIIHQDIKTNNIMVSYDLSFIKLIDFGICRTNAFGFVNFIETVCAISYRPPEILLEYEYYNNKIDIWSIGCVIAEMYNGKILFDASTKDMLKKIFSIVGMPTDISWPNIKDAPNWEILMEQDSNEYPKIIAEKEETPSLKTKELIPLGETPSLKTKELIPFGETLMENPIDDPKIILIQTSDISMKKIIEYMLIPYPNDRISAKMALEYMSLKNV